MLSVFLAGTFLYFNSKVFCLKYQRIVMPNDLKFSSQSKKETSAPNY